MQKRRALASKKIYINEDLTYTRHKLMFYLKSLPEIEATGSSNGAIMAKVGEKWFRIESPEDVLQTQLDIDWIEIAKIYEETM